MNNDLRTAVVEQVDQAREFLARWQLAEAKSKFQHARELVQNELDSPRSDPLLAITAAQVGANFERAQSVYNATHSEEDTILPSGVSIFERPVDLDWSVHGDRFLHLLDMDLRAAGVATQTGIDLDHEDASWVFDMVIDPNSPITSRLQIYAIGEGLDFHLCNDEGVPERERRWWESLIKALLAECKLPMPRSAWCAVIGPAPEDYQDLQGVVVENGRVAELTFGPIPSRALETISGSFIGQRTLKFRPVVVTGIHAPPVEGMYAYGPGRELKRLCAVFSLVSPWSWELKSEPQSLPEPGIDDIEAVEYLTTVIRERFQLSDRGSHSPAGDVLVHVPAWLKHAWKRLDADNGLAQILYTHHEARSLERRHPSVALMLHVATLDAIGKRLGAAGNRSRVRRSLEEAFPASNDADELMRAYDKRNQTAHEGVLHGAEFAYGYEEDSILDFSPEDLAFRIQMLRPASIASRRLLRLALRGRI